MGAAYLLAGEHQAYATSEVPTVFDIKKSGVLSRASERRHQRRAPCASALVLGLGKASAITDLNPKYRHGDRWDDLVPQLCTAAPRHYERALERKRKRANTEAAAATAEDTPAAAAAAAAAAAPVQRARIPTARFVYGTTGTPRCGRRPGRRSKGVGAWTGLGASEVRASRLWSACAERHQRLGFPLPYDMLGSSALHDDTHLPLILAINIAACKNEDADGRATARKSTCVVQSQKTRTTTAPSSSG